MGSYLAQWLDHKITAAQALAKSVVYMKNKAGITVSPDAVAMVENAAEGFINTVEALAAAYINTHLPTFPAVAATQIAHGVAVQLEQSIAAAANVVNTAEANSGPPSQPLGVVLSAPPTPAPPAS